MVGEPSHVKQLSLNHVCKIGLKSRGLANSATLPVGQKLLKNDSERTYKAQAVLDKFFDAGHYMKKHDLTLPVKGRFYG